jgi:hypothetical protein
MVGYLKYSPVWQKVKYPPKTTLLILLKPFPTSLDTWPNKTISAEYQPLDGLKKPVQALNYHKNKRGLYRSV